MLTKYHLIMLLIFRVTVAFLSPTNEASENHQKNIKNDLENNVQTDFQTDFPSDFQKDIQKEFQSDIQRNGQRDGQMDSPIGNANAYMNDSAIVDSYMSSTTLAKRGEKFFTLPLAYRNTYYYVDLEVGWAPDRVEALVDMEEADTWVMSDRVVCEPKKKRQVQSKRGNSEVDSSEVQFKKRNSGVESSKVQFKKRDSEVDSSEKQFKKRNSEVDSSGVQFKKVIPKHLNLGKRGNCKLHGFRSYGSRTLWRHEIQAFSSGPEKGIWGYDKVKVAGTTLKMMFGVPKITSGEEGCLGLGNPNDSKRWIDNGEPYLSFLMALKRLGYIKRLTYSVYLNGGGPANGSILFGAVDHAKHQGNLQTVPMVNIHRYEKKIGLSVALNKMYLEDSNQKVVMLNETIGAKLQLGNDYQTLPKPIFYDLINSLSAEYWPEKKIYRVNCGYRNGTRNMVYDFSGLEIKVPLSHLIQTTSDGTCFLAVLPSEDVDEINETFPYVNLRNSFLRNVYLNVDWDKREVSMAQVKVSQDLDIEEVSQSVPKALKANRYSFISLVSNITQRTVTKFLL